MAARSIEILDIASRFQQARIFLSASELGFFHALDEGARSAEELAAACGTDPRATACLLDAMVALGLVGKRRERYAVPVASRPLLSPRSPTSILPMVQHFARLWKRWHSLSEVVRTGDPSDDPSWFRAGFEASQADFIGAMHVLGRQLAGTVARACTVARDARRLLDIGGGSGTYTLAFLERYRHLEATIFDLPKVIPLAQARVGATRLAARVTYAAGNFDNDDLPGGHDLALLSAIIHQNSRQQNQVLFGKIHRALAAGGTLLIRDYVMDEGRTAPVLGALLAVNMLVTTRRGGTYTFDEIRDDLAGAGFRQVKLIRKGVYMDALVQASAA